MQFRGLLFSGAAAVLFSGILAACTVVVDEGPGYRPPPPPRPGPQFCTREYAPVCARQGSRLKTFPNSCEAGRSGYRIVSGGQCQSGGNWGPGPGPVPPQRACTREYAPVCATRRGAVRTFPNACEARSADWRIVDTNGPC